MALGDRATVVLETMIFMPWPSPPAPSARAARYAGRSIRCARRGTPAGLASPQTTDACGRSARAGACRRVARMGYRHSAGPGTGGQALLRDGGWRDHIGSLCGRAPTAWDASFAEQRRLRFIVAALTRMRLCTRRGALAPAARATPGHWPRETVPWFDLPTVAVQRHAVVFGHWAALGLLVRGDVVCLDTGCVSGGALTAYRLSDRKLVQVCAQPASPLAAAYGERPRYRARPGRSARGRALPIQA